MAEEKKTKNVDELLKQIEEFQATLEGLSTNVGNLKKKLAEGKKKHGVDMSKWPQDAT